MQKKKGGKNVEVLLVSRNKLQAILHKKQTFMIYSEVGRKNLPQRYTRAVVAKSC